MTESFAQANGAHIAFKFLFYDLCSVLAIGTCLGVCERSGQRVFVHSVGETLPVCSLLGPLCHVPVIPLHRPASLRCVYVCEWRAQLTRSNQAHMPRAGEEEKARDVTESVQRGQIERLYHSEHLMCKADALNCLKC